MPVFTNHFAKHYVKKSVIILCCITGLTLTACSGSNTETRKAQSSITSKSLTPYIHPENVCLNTGVYAHIGSEKQHQHILTCESTTKNQNAHIHPAKGEYLEIRHVHPNGSSKHSHH